MCLAHGCGLDLGLSVCRGASELQHSASVISIIGNDNSYPGKFIYLFIGSFMRVILV